ncbi:hypothetical protein MFIFM68171_04866 [Madurella fahalii]|uniref:Uncharacterized protein n=1 Tax=Madurella fahalii TaxID=1157608 RepID=A0ABQ0GA59_9PEZI
MPPLLLCTQPPEIPPTNDMATAANRLFRFLSAQIPPFDENSNGSLNKSQYKLVNTFVGTSLYPNVLLATIWPPNRNANNTRGASDK